MVKSKRNSIPKAKAKHTKRRTKKAVPVRASERGGFSLNVKAAALRDLMTEQSRTPGGYATYYSGTQTELINAGIPEYLFPKNDNRARIHITNHAGYHQDGCIQRKGQIYELTLRWDGNGPWYFSAEHPALSEIARMIHINAHSWIETDDFQSNEVPTQKLLECNAATDYRLPAHKRFKFGPGFRRAMFSYIDQIHHAIKCAEIMPIEQLKAQYDEPKNGNVVNFNKARATFAANKK